ncbi:MAG: PEP/pyruvate-binding domain-containing protein [Anaerolineaceae bacterium]|nr:PEP/pyruvate-binding domain-containing protein [Anaerolineaceae bacterium]MCB9100884.1 PEP/pyruvate-binding domain-containing protein [Anaerolineales bacterium]
MFNRTIHSKILNLRLALNSYPILSEKIRQRMRQELFVRGIIAPNVFEEEVELKAIESQKLEGLTEPLFQEPEEIWLKRLARVRDNLTDFYFAYNLPQTLFEEIVESSVNENRNGQPRKVILTINPELTPWNLLFAQAEKYAAYPPELYENVKHHLMSIVVVLIKGLVSDHLAFIHIARKFITIFDLREIRAHRIGRGKIGGKAAGMLLAYNILDRPEPDDEIDLSSYIGLPETHFLGSDVYYNFKDINNFEQFSSQKYLTREEIEREYPRILEAYLSGKFPKDITDKLRELLEDIGDAPMIVRSSSLLEDNFGSSFAGKYESYFLPNQGTIEENLAALIEAIIKIYASVLTPDALFYRQIHGLDDYDERMAILIQKVQGNRYGKYFFSYIAGVGFSRNPFIWNNKLRREDGFLRIVLGLGTRAVDRVSRDYPRMIGLSHPLIRPEKTSRDIIRYSQQFIDAIDLEEGGIETIPVSEVLSSEFPGFQYIASVDEGDYVKPVFSLVSQIPSENLVLTFDNLLKNTDFAKIMKTILKKLERHYERPVDIEFTVELIPGYPKPSFKIYLLQCRPLSNRDWDPNIVVPQNIPRPDQIFSSTHIVPQGIVEKIKYIIYVNPERYIQTHNNSLRLELARTIGRLNKKLEGEVFILMGPGRWGSSNSDLGVKISYADIYNTSMLIEIAIPRNGANPELSYGTHFFQDLVETNIYPLALFPESSETVFNKPFFDQAPNQLALLLPQDSDLADYVKVINVPKVSQGRLLRVVMSANHSQALAYLYQYDS